MKSNFRLKLLCSTLVLSLLVTACGSAYGGGTELDTSVEDTQNVSVQEDEKENGVRALLNLGHTFGHAIEAVSNFEVTHGEGVAIGLCCAGEMALRLGLWQKDEFARMRELMDKLHLPSKIAADWKFDDMLKIMLHDKKAENGSLKFILPDSIGSSVIQKNISENLIRESVEACRE